MGKGRILRKEYKKNGEGKFERYIVIYEGGEVIAYLRYYELEDRVIVDYLEVKECYRRKGIATRMLERLNEKYKGKKIGWMEITSDGGKLLKSIGYM